MPQSNEDKPGILGKGLNNFKNKLVIDTSNKFADATSAFALSAASLYISPISCLALDAASTLAATAINCFAQSGAKRKTESGNAEYSVGGGEGDFGCVHKLGEITNKRPHVVDNFVPREKEEQKLDELFNIPKPVAHFEKRKEIEELCENFGKNCSIQVLTSQVSIIGLGGIGKTQLAAKFVEKNTGEYKSNFWIDAERYCIIDSFKQLAKKIGVSLSIEGEGEKSKSCLVKDVYKELCNQKTLIVFDNVDDYDSVKEFLPHQDDKKINVLITSRYNKWENTGVRPVELGVFTLKESIGFIKKELKVDNDEKAEELYNKLQGLPLALQQAISYIKQQQNVDSKFGIEDYLKEYDKEAEKLLSYDLHEKNNDPYMKTVMTTWQVTLDKIEKVTTCGKEAIRILNVMAYLVPDNIKNSMFQELIGGKTAEAISLLRSYSMINQGSKSDLSNIHRLVQEVTRIKLKNAKKEKEEITEEAVLGDAFDVLNKRHNTRSSTQLSINNKDYKTMSAVLICIHASNYDSLHEKISQLFKSLINEEKEQSSLVVGTKEIVKNNNFFIKYAVQENNVVLVNLILNSMENEWSSHDVQKLLIDCINNDYAQKSEVIKFLISRIKDIGRISVINNSNCMNVVKSLAELRKLNKELKFEYLVQAIEESNFDSVEFILKNEPSLVREKLTEDSFACDDESSNEYTYYVTKGSDISKLVCEVKKHLDNYLSKLKRDELNQKIVDKYCKNMNKIFELIEKVKRDEKKMQNISSPSNNSNSTNYPSSDIKDEMESDTESLLSVGDEDLGFELLDLDEEKPPILEFLGQSTEALENDLDDAMEENPRSTVHSPSVTRSGQMYSGRY